MLSALAPAKCPFVIGFANSFEKEVELPRKFDIRKSKAANISWTLFCTGVPVRINLWWARMRRDAFAVTVGGDNIRIRENVDLDEAHVQIGLPVFLLRIR